MRLVRIVQVVEHFQARGLTHRLGTPMAARPLVVLHERHFFNFAQLPPDDQVPRAGCHGPSWPIVRLAQCAQPLDCPGQARVNEWKASNLLYTTPRAAVTPPPPPAATLDGLQTERRAVAAGNMNDDWFWLYAGVAGPPPVPVPAAAIFS